MHIEIWFRVVTRNDGTSWVYRDNKEYCGPFLTRDAALSTAASLDAAVNSKTTIALISNPRR